MLVVVWTKYEMAAKNVLYAFCIIVRRYFSYTVYIVVNDRSALIAYIRLIQLSSGLVLQDIPTIQYFEKHFLAYYVHARYNVLINHILE